MTRADGLCDRCKVVSRIPSERNIRFCKECLKIVMDEMAASGYLTPKPRPTMTRPDNIGGPKYGDEGNSTDNTAKTVEGG